MSEDFGAVRVGDRVRWLEVIPTEGTPEERDKLGEVISLVTSDGEPVEAMVQWFGEAYPQEVRASQLEVLWRPER